MNETQFTASTEADLVPLKVGSWVEILVFLPLNAVLAFLVVVYSRKLLHLRARPFLKNREPALAIALCYGFTLRSVLSATQICFPGAWICGIYRVITAVIEALCFSTFLLRLLALYFRFVITKFAVLVSKLKDSSSPWKSWVLRNRSKVIRGSTAFMYTVFAVNAIGNVADYLANTRPEAALILSGQPLCYVLFTELYDDYDIRMLIAAVSLAIVFSLLLWSVKENYKIKQELLCIGLSFGAGVVVRGVLLLIPGAPEVVLTWFDFSSTFVVTLPCYALFYFSLYRPLKISEELEQNQKLVSDFSHGDTSENANLLRQDSEVARERKETVIQSIRMGKKPEGSHLSSKLEAFLTVLQDDAKRRDFEQFLYSEFAVENLLFYNDVASFRRSPTREEARRLYSTYIEENSTLEINISSRCRLDLGSKIDNVSDAELDSLYDEAALEVLRLMYRDSFIRFQMTAQFRKPSPSEATAPTVVKETSVAL